MVNSSPVLPASVEEAYRQKCIELKKRLKECENANDLLVVRNHRLRRGIQRLRLERSLLLREIERRIDPRMDDSDGTPSPPPTVCILHSCSYNRSRLTCVLFLATGET